MRNIKELIHKHYPGIVLAIALILFFYGYLFLYRGLPKTEVLIFNQPDEMANYAFVKEWVLSGRVGIPEPLSEAGLNQIHPRSMTVVGGRLVPIGFPGFIALVTSFVQPWVWVFGAALFNWLVIILTPLVAASSAILLYGISRSLGLTKPAALISGLGLLMLPPWWYYASRPLQANTLFVFFVLAGLWAALRKNEKLTRFFLVGLSFGLALFIRPSEWIWVFSLIGCLGYYNREFLGLRRGLAFSFGIGLMGLLFFLTQFAFYGSWLGSGYVRPEANGSAGLITTGPQGIYLAKALFLPFGFDALEILKTVYHYGLKLFLPWTVAAVIGFGFLFVNRKSYPLFFKYAGGVLLLGAWLALYYGPWQFTDNLAGQVSIGSSQVRYFLPLYVLALPLIAYLISSLFSWKWAGKLSAVLICLALLGASVKSVFFKFEGLYQVKQTVAQYYEWQKKIIALTPENAIIVTRYADKYIFPHRNVLATLDTFDGIQAIKKLIVNGAAVYFYDLPDTFYVNYLRRKEIVLDKPMASWENLELRKILLTK